VPHPRRKWTITKRASSKEYHIFSVLGEHCVGFMIHSVYEENKKIYIQEPKSMVVTNSLLGICHTAFAVLEI
jgi:hypothetical protein